MSAIYRCCQLVLHLAIPVLKDSSSPNERSRFNLEAECLVYTLNGPTDPWMTLPQATAGYTGGGFPSTAYDLSTSLHLTVGRTSSEFNLRKGGVLYSGYNKGGGGYAAGAGLGGANGPPQYVSSSSSSSASSSASSSVNGGGGAIIQIPHHHQKHKHVNRKGPEYFNDVFNVSTGACTLSGQGHRPFNVSTGACTLSGQLACWATDHSTTVGVLGHRPFNVSTGTCTLSGQDHRPSLYLQDSARVPKTNLRKEVKILVKKDESTKIPISALSAVSKLMSNEQKLVLSRFLSNRTLCDSTSSSLCDTSGSLREFKRPLGSRVTVGDARKGASNLHGAAVKTVVKYRDNTGVKSRIRGEVYTAGGGVAAGGGAVGGGGLVGGSGASSSSSSWSSSSSAGAGIGGFPSQETVAQNGPDPNLGPESSEPTAEQQTSSSSSLGRH
uniref:Uncharacterized protein n=1 Tax=Timema bartmani TaxID=61472 RepID=A0A7R9HZK6_9NEOP|nr:unnamed protein product [Timema bartmani]